MDPNTVDLITGHGMPLLIASAVCVAIKLWRVPLVQNFLARLSVKLVWDNWPKPLCSLVVILAATAAAFIASVQQGTPVKRALLDALMGAFLAMGLDAQHESLTDRASTNKADSIAVPIPGAIVKGLILCVLANSLMSCASFKTLMAPTTPAECATTQAISGDVRDALGSGTLGTSIAALEDQAGASQKVLTATSVGLGAGAMLASGWHWYVDAVQCPETGAMLLPAHSATESPGSDARSRCSYGCLHDPGQCTDGVSYLECWRLEQAYAEATHTEAWRKCHDECANPSPLAMCTSCLHGHFEPVTP
jgi:hypothetical protein